MTCPICGIDLPDKTRKCPKCGCHPSRFYGRPHPPKWLFVGIAAVLAVILALGAWLLFAQGRSAQKDWLIPLRTKISALHLSTAYTYDEDGNLLSAKTKVPSLDDSAAATVTFRYENGICTGFDLLESDDQTVSRTGDITYHEDLSRVSVSVKGSISFYNNTWTFQYDENGQISEIQWGDTFSNRYTLRYDANGRLIYRDCWQQPLLSSSSTFAPSTMTYAIEYLYDEQGTLIGFARADQAGNKRHYTCKPDDRGNVTEVLPTAGQEIYFGDYALQYAYEYREVADHIARQYQLQLYLLEALMITPESTVIPFEKTPLT